MKAFLSARPVLWFLFPFSGGVAAVSYLTLDDATGIATAAAMDLVALGATGGLVAGRRRSAGEGEEPAPDTLVAAW
ncbi:hypothetical protein AV521_37765 [Streptomyces sp. IMTB 2501]|nr:hypothetical protein AV521_37765 [Streptomyces sp. IMTB 2501]